ncbi:MAG: SAM-dependent methyltransferase, partial [Candidatus Saccharibacteria bacterium]|nr:SAM-dependent methyltransferase [Rhodoferax sp.]
MNSTTSKAVVQAFTLPQGTPAAARTVLKLLQRLRHGHLTVHLPDGSVRHFGAETGMRATLTLNNWNVCSAALKSGDIGFAESFIAGDWTTANLTDLLRVLVKNRAEVDNVIYGSWAGRLFYRIKHLLNRN